MSISKWADNANMMHKQNGIPLSHQEKWIIKFAEKWTERYSAKQGKLGSEIPIHIFSLVHNPQSLTATCLCLGGVNVGTEQETWRGPWDCGSRVGIEERYIKIYPNNASLQGKTGSTSLPWHHLTNRACPLRPFKFKQEEDVKGYKRPYVVWRMLLGLAPKLPSPLLFLEVPLPFP